MCQMTILFVAFLCNITLLFMAYMCTIGVYKLYINTLTTNYIYRFILAVMNKELFCFLSFIILIGCTDTGKERYTIAGTVPKHGFENEWIYLVPLTGATKETVDSTQVKNGMFSFEGVVDTSDIRILRTRPILRFKLQELLVVVEQGKLNVLLDSVSCAQGTPQNDALQQWKEEKMKTDRELMSLSQQKKNADPSVADSIGYEQEQIKDRFNEYNFNFVKSYGFNTVGSFVYSTSRHTFSEEQKAELEKLRN